MTNNNPIGVLDSGLGGLTIWKEITALLPHESTIYIGDSKNAPYGARHTDEIYRLSQKMIAFLLSKGVKLIVLACNTITVSCLDKLRENYPDMPIVGTVPVIKTAAAVTRNKQIGVLSTTYTAKSQYQKKLIAQFANGCIVHTHGTDALVPLIEKGEISGEKIEYILKTTFAKFKKEKVDTIALGCTHFPFLRTQMREILGPQVALLDSGAAIARQVKRVLENNNTLTEQKHPRHEFYTTGDPRIAKKLLAGTIAEEKEFQKIFLGDVEDPRKRAEISST